MGVFFEQIQLQPGESFRVLRWRQHLGEVETLTPNGEVIPLAGAGERWHYHPEVELTLVETGGGTRLAGDHVARFAAPDLVLIGASLPHYWRGLQPSSGMALQFDPASPPFRALPEMEALQQLLGDARRGLRLKGAVKMTIRKRLKEMISARGPVRLALLWQILALLNDAPETERELLSERDFAQIADSPYQSQMEKAVRWIFENADQGRVRLGPLLKSIGMSKPTFSRQFPRHTGRTFNQFLNEVRLDHARHKLVETGHAIAAIAFESGYENLSHFNRMFRRHAGETPSAYRLKMRGF